MPRKKSVSTQTLPPVVAQVTSPESEEQLVEHDTDRIAEAIHEVALAFRDLTETLARIFLSQKVPLPEPAPVTPEPPKVEVPVAPVAPPPPPPAPTVVIAPPVVPLPPPPPPAPPAEEPKTPVILPADVENVRATFIRLHETQDEAGNYPYRNMQIPVSTVVTNLRDQILPHLPEPHVFGILKHLWEVAKADPSHMLFELLPPSGGKPAMLKLS